jgi:selenocysteine-specific elongation factor
MAKVRLLDRQVLEPGETGWAQVVLSEPVAVVKGDFYILRSTRDTLGGGEVVAVHAKRHRRFQTGMLESLSVMERGASQEVVLSTLEQKQPVKLEELATRCNLSVTEVDQVIKSLVQEEQAVALGGSDAYTLVMTAKGWEDLATQTVQSYHRRFPLRQGMPKEELRNKLKIPSQAFSPALDRLVRQGTLVDETTSVRLLSHGVQLTKEQQAAIDAFVNSITENPYSPPSDLLPDPQLLELLIERHQVVRVSDNVVFLTQAYEEIVKRIVERLESVGSIDVAGVKDLFNMSRKYAIALLEHLDTRKITRRVGDERVLFS